VALWQRRQTLHCRGISTREQADGTYATSPRVVVAPVVKESFMYGYKYLPLLAIPDFPVHISLNKQLIDSFIQPTHWKLDEVSLSRKTG
jgi:hypothetical protein